MNIDLEKQGLSNTGLLVIQIGMFNHEIYNVEELI